MGKKLLIAAGESATRVDDLPFGIRELIDAADEILVIAPMLPTRLEWLASATDERREEADERLQTVLGQIEQRDAAPDAEGEIGADDPLLAFEDACRSFSPNHVLVSLRRNSSWQEDGLIDQLVERIDVPITAFTVS